MTRHWPRSRKPSSSIRELRAAQPEEEHRPGSAMALNNQSRRLAELGHQVEAVAAATDAVTIYRELATTRPDAFRPGLAMALGNQSLWLAALGRLDQHCRCWGVHHHPPRAGGSTAGCVSARPRRLVEQPVCMAGCRGRGR